MIALQRHRQILERVTEDGSVRVTELAQWLDVTEETVRRDLRTLSDQGRLTRTHGGAVALDHQDGRVDLPFDQRHGTHVAAKAAIARAAASLIRPGQVIALDASSTAGQLAKLIPDQPLTVVTNSLFVCSTLATRPRIEVVCTGGTLDADAMAFYGLHAQRTLERLNIETLFFSARGIDLDRGLSEANDRHAAIKQRMIESSQRRVLMADASKIGLASTVFYGHAAVADRLVVEPTDDPAKREALDTLADRGVEVTVADVSA